MLADFTADRRLLYLSALAVLIGSLCALVAALLLWLIAFFTNLFFYQRISFASVEPAGHGLGPWVVAVPVAGAVLIGLMARYGSEKIRGHGIPEALEAILIGKSLVQPRVAILKPLSSALSIGTGGPFGAEGPIIMTGGACGSILAQFFNLSAQERKTLLVAGAAGGMSATFNAPVASVLFAVEMLLFEWKPRSVVPVAVASAVAAIIRPLLLGSGPLFAIAPHPPFSTEALMGTLLVGVLGGLGAVVLTAAVYGAEDAFRKLPIHWMWWPAIGSLVVGVGGYFFPRVLGVGYENIQGLLLGEITGRLLIGLLIAKAIVWAVALGSGTSGGVLAPLLFIGGSMGALAAPILPGGIGAGAWALIGMAAIFAGTMRSPFTAVFFALELTYDVSLLFPVLIACVVAYGMTTLVLKRSILTEKLARRGVHVSREYQLDPLEVISVRAVMTQAVHVVQDTMLVSTLRALLDGGEGEWSHHGYPVVDSDGNLVGIVTRSDLHRATDSGAQTSTVGELVRGRELVVAYPDEPLSRAADKMALLGVGRLPVVERGRHSRLIGIITRNNILAARREALLSEYQRERPFKGVTGRNLPGGTTAFAK